jgi:hypothetical protein
VEARHNDPFVVEWTDALRQATRVGLAADVRRYGKQDHGFAVEHDLRLEPAAQFDGHALRLGGHSSLWRTQIGVTTGRSDGPKHP